jgi:hypothetical protein
MIPDSEEEAKFFAHLPMIAERVVPQDPVVPMPGKNRRKRLRSLAARLRRDHDKVPTQVKVVPHVVPKPMAEKFKLETLEGRNRVVTPSKELLAR